MPAADPEAFRLLPAVEALLSSPPFAPLLARFGRPLVREAVRTDLGRLRAELQGGLREGLDTRVAPEACAARAAELLAARTRPAYVGVLNATGIVLHTGLGRAPLADAARRALADAAGFAAVEVEVASGRRGRRDDGVAALLRELTGAEDACVVNNNAGATLIALAALARGRAAVVSRGQLVEIGGSYRIPDVMEQSGARMVEVGTTNRTHARDYRAALEAHPDVALLLRVHTSNFRVMGFTHEVPLEELVAIGRERGVEVMDDLGSGCLVDLAGFGLPAEPMVQESLAASAGVVTFSGDKLLGGPQAGLIAGKAPLVARIRAHPLYRALRPDKLTLAALEATLALYRDPEGALEAVPALRMIAAPRAALEARARGMAEALARIEGLDVRLEEGTSRVGGGSYAVEALPTCLVSLRPASLSLDALAGRLRLGSPALFARIHEGRLKLDPRTLLGPAEDAAAVGAVRRALGAAEG